MQAVGMRQVLRPAAGIGSMVEGSQEEEGEAVGIRVDDFFPDIHVTMVCWFTAR